MTTSCPALAAAIPPCSPRQLMTVAPGARPPSRISSQATPALGEPHIEMADEPALELVLVLQSLGLHARLRGGSPPPLGLGAFIAADVDELRREELEHLVENILEETKHVVAHSQHVIGDAPVRQHVDQLSGVAELWIC